MESLPLIISLSCAFFLCILVIALVFNAAFREDVLGGEGEASILGIITVKGVVIVLLCALFLAGLVYPITKNNDSVPNNNQVRHFEGEWNYEAEFLPFHRRNDLYISNGIVFFRWSEGKDGYEIFHSYSINKEWDKLYIVTGFGEGFLHAPDGWPPSNFTLEFDYLGRTGLEGFEGTGRSSYKMEGISYNKPAEGDYISTLNGSYDFRSGTEITTAGTFSLSRR